MKKIVTTLLMTAVILSLLTGCNQTGNDTGSNNHAASDSDDSHVSGSFKSDNTISVVSREDGSGTRGAFIELFGVEVKNDDGSKKDMTTKEASIVNKTDVMMTTIANDPYAIGYISLGSLNGTIKSVDIDGVKASAENVKNGTYKIARPFNIAFKGELSETAQDFVNFILSREGQEVVSESYIAIDDNAPDYKGSNQSGKIVVAGSSSVSPIMEKLKESYETVNSNVTIEIQTNDSTAGMTGAIEGTCDIGMASRELKDSEKETLTDMAIALDGITVIVNNENPLTGLTVEQVKNIFTGESTNWSGIE